MKPYWMITLAAAGLQACSITSEVSDTSVIASALNCQTCGLNGPTIVDGLIFDEIDSSGNAANAGGIRLVAARLADGSPVAVQVVGHDLIAVGQDARGVPMTYRGSALQGLTLMFEHVDGARYELEIATVGQTTFWTQNTNEVPLFQFLFRKKAKARPGEFHGRTATPEIPEAEPDPAGSRGRPLCTGLRLDSEAELTALAYSAVVFEGDQYDTVRRTVSERPNSPWFNLACIGTSSAKMHLIRHTSASRFVFNGQVQSTTVDERTAMLKMLAADYCGDGHTFTVNGFRLNYMDSKGWYQMSPFNVADLQQLEAIWGPDGAVCLNTPRLADPVEVRDHCTAVGRRMPPPCTSQQALDWTAFGHVASGF